MSMSALNVDQPKSGIAGSMGPFWGLFLFEIALVALGLFAIVAPVAAAPAVRLILG